MPIRYLCLDDDARAVRPIVELLQQSGPDFELEVRTPANFDDEIRMLLKAEFDGLLLDLRLDRTADESGARVNYRALSLAQELRTRMTEGEMTSRPLVLWSVDDNFQLSYDKDETGHDLFDRKYYKGSVTADAPRMAAELIDLALGYKNINALKSRTIKNIYSRLIDLPDAFSIIDPRIANDIAENRSYPAHAFARSILQNLIFGAGPLIDERLLAARLGVDIEASDDWERLKSKLSATKYTGTFGNAWPRWWMFKLLAAFKEVHPSSPIQRLEASERVSALKSAFKLSKLTAAHPLVDGYDARFWFVCKLLSKPIAPTDAVQLSVERREWQDGIYASVKSILDRTHKSEGYEIHPFEQPRIAEMMAALRDDEKK
ncbi:hypothetical protein [Nitrobacter hamburgensis]|nr:hypothetical protein [Nitrobacter hamburgensis]